MNLSQLIHDLSALVPVLGPGAPVLQHERLRISNDRDSVQVIDDEIENARIHSLEKEIEELNDLPDHEEELRETEAKLADAMIRIQDIESDRDDLSKDLHELQEAARELVNQAEGEVRSPSRDLLNAINAVTRLT